MLFERTSRRSVPVLAVGTGAVVVTTLLTSGVAQAAYGAVPGQGDTKLDARANYN